MEKKRMRVLKLKTLREFWQDEPNAKVALELWYKKITSQHWANAHEVKAAFPGADQVGNNRIVFNIRHNDYRLIILFRYQIQICYVRFIDKHEVYDQLKNISTI